MLDLLKSLTIRTFSEYSENPVVLNRVVTFSLQKFSSDEKADDIIEFFQNKDTSGFSAGLNQVPILLETGTHCFRALNRLEDLRGG